MYVDCEDDISKRKKWQKLFKKEEECDDVDDNEDDVEEIKRRICCVWINNCTWTIGIIWKHKIFFLSINMQI